MTLTYTLDTGNLDHRQNIEILSVLWQDVTDLLGRDYAGPEDDARIVAALALSGAPLWIVDAVGQNDEYCWMLAGPSTHERIDISLVHIKEQLWRALTQPGYPYHSNIDSQVFALHILGESDLAEELIVRERRRAAAHAALRDWHEQSDLPANSFLDASFAAPQHYYDDLDAAYRDTEGFGKRFAAIINAVKPAWAVCI